MNYKFIITLNENAFWGYNLQPVLVNVSENGIMSILEILSSKSTIFTELTENQQKIIRLYEKYAEKTLMKNFSKEKSIADFRQKLKPETIERYIRPLIESNHSQILTLIQQSGEKVYYRSNVKTRVLSDSNMIQLAAETPSVIFNFIKKSSDELSYSIQLKYKNSFLKLQNNFFAQLCNEPAAAVIENTLYLFDDIDAKKLLPFFTKDFINIPETAYRVYLEKFVVNCVKKYDVNADGFEIKEVFPEKEAYLTLVNDLNWFPVLRLDFHYGDMVFPSQEKNNSKVVFVDENGEIPSVLYFYRDKIWEDNLIKLLLDNGLLQKNINDYYLAEKRGSAELNNKDIDSIIKWLTYNDEILHNFRFSQSLEQTYYIGEIETHFNVISNKIDWFNLQSEVVFGNFRIPFNNFRHHILNGVHEYVLPDKSIAILPDEWFTAYYDLMCFAKKEANELILSRKSYRLLEFIGKKEIAKIGDFDPEATVFVPEGIKAELRPYQQKGFAWLVHLYKNNFGGCLADDMGLGKTLQTITLLQYIADENALQEKPDETLFEKTRQLSLFESAKTSGILYKAVTSLIVVPTSLLFNWQNELKRFAPGLRVLAYSGGKRERNKRVNEIFKCYDLVLTTYGTLRNDITLLSEFSFHYLILDESQYIKNPDSVTYKAVKQITATHKLSLTGTPIENSLTDLWAQFELINEGMLGSYNSFQKRYVNPINREDEEKEKNLLWIIQPFIMRRTKSEVAPELPPLTEEVIYCDMTDEQAALYKKEKNMLRNSLISEDKLLDGNRITFAALQGITRLRMLANHPRFVDNEYSESSGKYEQILMQLESLLAGKHKVLVFSSFVRHLRLFADCFEQRYLKYAWLTGATPVAEREAEINRFMNEKDVNCFFVSLKAGGVGLNLTAADYVFILDPWWNPAAEMQAVSRSHRIGQEKHVIVYRFITSGTIEEKIRRLQESKSKLAEKFITSANPLKALKKEDVEELLN